MTSCYYQAFVVPAQTWFFTATLRSYEHLAFDRTKDPQTGLFEFFVAPESTQVFEHIMRFYEEQGIIHGFKRMVPVA